MDSLQLYLLTKRHWEMSYCNIIDCVGSTAALVALCIWCFQAFGEDFCVRQIYGSDIQHLYVLSVDVRMYGQSAEQISDWSWLDYIRAVNRQTFMVDVSDWTCLINHQWLSCCIKHHFRIGQSLALLIHMEKIAYG